MEIPAVQFINVSKRFPGAAALSGVSFPVLRGSCHAVCGENGAGKSTLAKVLAGIERADSGEVRLDNVKADCRTPREALGAGIVLVHQEMVCCENMTVAENLCLGNMPSRLGFVDRAAMRDKARKLLGAIGADIHPDREMAALTVAEQQLVQIAAAMGSSARVIILDEPTSSLSESEVQKLEAMIARLRSEGVTFLFVSHRMPEIFRLCNFVTVLRDGKHVATQPAATLDEDMLVQLMIGRRLERPLPDNAAAQFGEERLRVEQLSRPGFFSDISFSIHAGEVVGLAGLVGAGRTAIGEALFGLDAQATGSIRINGQSAAIRSPRQAMAHGIGFVPEDRKRLGLVLSMTTRENMTLPTVARHVRWTMVDIERERAVVDAMFGKLRVRASRHSMIAALSGGNQQKVVIAKWLAADSDILILDEPTRGVDVGAKAEIHSWISRLAAGGAAVLLISSDLPELLALSHRVLVLRRGRLTGELPAKDATQDAVMRMM